MFIVMERDLKQERGKPKMENRRRADANIVARHWETILMLAGMAALVFMGTMQAMRGMNY